MKEQFPQSWKDQLETLGFDTFTEIQEQIFSPIYEGENVLGISPIGTGRHSPTSFRACSNSNRRRPNNS